MEECGPAATTSSAASAYSHERAIADKRARRNDRGGPRGTGAATWFAVGSACCLPASLVWPALRASTMASECAVPRMRVVGRRRARASDEDDASIRLSSVLCVFEGEPMPPVLNDGTFDVVVSLNADHSVQHAAVRVPEVARPPPALALTRPRATRVCHPPWRKCSTRDLTRTARSPSSSFAATLAGALPLLCASYSPARSLST